MYKKVLCCIIPAILVIGFLVYKNVNVALPNVQANAVMFSLQKIEPYTIRSVSCPLGDGIAAVNKVPVSAPPVPVIPATLLLPGKIPSSPIIEVVSLVNGKKSQSAILKIGNDYIDVYPGFKNEVMSLVKIDSGGVMMKINGETKYFKYGY